MNIWFRHFSLTLAFAKDEDAFCDELEALCRKYAGAAYTFDYNVEVIDNDEESSSEI